MYLFIAVDLKKLRYKGATVFVDPFFFDIAYVHLMSELNGETTVKSKQAFERLVALHRINIKHYLADNGLFRTKVFKNSIQCANQTISFCGVNAHHQNGKSENQI